MKCLSSISIISFLLLCIIGCNNTTTSHDLVNNIIQTAQVHSSISYDINYQIKTYNSIEDTIKLSAKIDLIRIPTDDIMGGYVWISSDSTEQYYNTEAFYFIDHKGEYIIKYPVDKTAGQFIEEARKIYFLQPEKLLKAINDTTNIVNLTEETINHTSLWKLGLTFTSDEMASNIKKNVWIDKTKYSIPKINFSIDMQGENQYNQWDIYNTFYDTVTIEMLERRLETFTSKYPITEYKPLSYKDRQPLPKGSILPDITGQYYSNGGSYNSQNDNGKLTIYDFWYMDCMPCIKAIPELNKLQHKYGNNGLSIIGLNPYNNDENGKRRFPNFLDKNPVDYPIVFVDKKDTKDFKIIGYPTLYILDKSNTVIYSQTGHMDDFAYHMDSLINANL